MWMEMVACECGDGVSFVAVDQVDGVYTVSMIDQVSVVPPFVLSKFYRYFR